MTLGLVTEAEQAPTADPVEEIREGAEILARLRTNPLLPEHAQMAIQAIRAVLTRRLPCGGVG